MENKAKYVQATDSVNLFHKRDGNLNSSRNEIKFRKKWDRDYFRCIWIIQILLH